MIVSFIIPQIFAKMIYVKSETVIRGILNYVNGISIMDHVTLVIDVTLIIKESLKEMR